MADISILSRARGEGNLASMIYFVSEVYLSCQGLLFDQFYFVGKLGRDSVCIRFRVPNCKSQTLPVQILEISHHFFPPIAQALPVQTLEISHYFLPIIVPSLTWDFFIIMSPLRTKGDILF